MRALTLAAAVPLLALTACASPVTGSASPASAADRVQPAVPVTVPGAADPEADAGRCTSDAGYTVSFPADWATNAAGVLPACSWFGPGEEVVVPEASDVRTAPVTLRVVDGPLAQAAPVYPDEVARTTTEVGGRPAVRTEQVTTVGLYPAGTRITSWAVDLGGRTLLADAVELPGGDHRRAVAVLDAMVGELRTTTV
ncbi:hypothetical protein [Geodermatophilus sp. DSM 44513]|uniref:hypothetical protein n=1 Tax=Geodermatophilus sp. DSM 44513 TaxID=1528104 RepID=UPI00128049CD|nr:hypothetical protein [Geodermatophilus sp. DSM 44513]WNV77245.1 hypothetical protein RTG05_08220 [Geodermatophilus sp. DSM 44513]